MKAIHGRLGRFYAWLSKKTVRISVGWSVELLVKAQYHYEKAK